MNSFLDLLKLALKESDAATFSNFLQVCKDNGLFQKECNQDNIIGFVNSLLNVSNSFKNGVELLRVLLPQCKSDLVGQHLLKWLQFCVNGLQNNSPSLSVYCLLRELIISSKDYPDVNKQMSMTLIPKIMDHFMRKKPKFSNQIFIPFLLCLEQILANYGRACGSWKSQLEQFLLMQLENSTNIVDACATCFLNLAAVGPTKGDMEDYKEDWIKKQSFLISALHLQLDGLFNPINEIQGSYDSYVIEVDKNSLPEILETSPIKRAQRSTLQFINLAMFLNKVLIGKFPVSKRINPAAILSVVCRGLAINCTTLEANISNDKLILSSQIPAIQKACIGILESLILSCRRNLIYQGKLICKLLTQTLKWTKVDCEYGQNRPYSLLRVDAYNCFTTWLTITRQCSSVEDHMDDILPSILSDIHSEKPVITLNVTTKRLKGKVGKKQRKQNKELSSIENKLSTTVNPEANKDICEAALNFLPLLLEAASSLISPTVHKQLQERVINELMMIQGAEQVSLDLPIPYSDDLCRLGLYRSLLALCNNYHPEFPTPCNYALTIFTVGLRDSSLVVSRFCGQAVSNIERILQPIVPTLNFPLVLSNEMTSTNSNTSNKLVEVNSQSKVLTGNTKESDDTSNDKHIENDSEVLESINDLFENQLSNIPPSTIRSNGDDQNEKISSNANNLDETISQEITYNVQEKNCEKQQEMVVEKEAITSDNLINSKENHNKQNETETLLQNDKNKIQKRVRDDETNYPKEKRKKVDGITKVDNKQNINEINELEEDMLSSFVDIVK